MKVIDRLNNYKIKNLIIVSFIFIVLVIFLINFLIIKLFLLTNTKNELLSRDLARAKSYAVQLEDPLMLGDITRAVAIIFDNKYSRNDVAYQLIVNIDGTLIANNFVGEVPNRLLGQHSLPEDTDSDIKLIYFQGQEIYDIATRMDYDLGILRTGYYKGQIDITMNRSIIILLASILVPMALAITLAFLYSFLILRPINILKEGVKNVAAGNLNNITDITSKDELGELAESFNLMTSNLRNSKLQVDNYSSLLEEKVAVKTREIENMLKSVQKDKNELESQRVAILNILEDVQNSEQELKDSNIELDRGRTELEALKSLSDELLGVLTVPEAVDVTVKYLDKAVDYLAVTALVFDPLSEEDVIFRSYMRKKISDEMLQAVRAELIDFMEKNSNEQMSHTLKIVNNLKPDIIGLNPGSEANTGETFKIVLPVIIGGRFAGAVHLIAAKKIFQTFTGENFIKTAFATFAATAARLQILNQTQHSKTETLIKSLSDGVIMFSLNKKIILSNPAILHLLKDKNELNNISELGGLFTNIEIEKNIDEVLQAGMTKRLGETEIGDHYFEIILSPVKDTKEQVTGGAIILHDITHLKEIDKMKTEFVSVASHQLRTPLTAIKLFTEMMVRGDVGELSPDQKDYLNNIYESTERMVRLVNDLLSLSRLESGRLKVEPKPTSLESMIESVIAEVKPLADSKKCRIIFTKPATGLPEIPMDPNLVRQVAHNLITNAVRYSKEGDGLAEVNIMKTSDFYELAVKDNGIGISQSDQKRMFEKFFRADNAVKKETEGSGLGLYVCRMIAEVSGGKIWFESIIDQGTTFHLNLPIKGVAPQAGEKTLPSDQHNINYS
jgi:signal transduction histidine kinase